MLPSPSSCFRASLPAYALLSLSKTTTNIRSMCRLLSLVRTIGQGEQCRCHRKRSESPRCRGTRKWRNLDNWRDSSFLRHPFVAFVAGGQALVWTPGGVPLRALGRALEASHSAGLGRMCRSRPRCYSSLKRCLLMCRLLILDSRVERGIPSFAAAPFGPDTRP